MPSPAKGEAVGRPDSTLNLQDEGATSIAHLFLELLIPGVSVSQ